jgi:hypothetical protein
VLGAGVRVGAGACALAAVLSGPALSRAQEGAADDARVEAAARRVLELRRELEAVLAELPPELRARVEARVEELARDGDGARSTGAAPAEAVPRPSDTQGSSTQADASPEAPRAAPAPLASAARDVTVSLCAGLAALDRDGDAVVSAIDRSWRHLYLWSDDGDEAIEPEEVRSLFELGVRSLHAASRTYTTDSGFVGDIDVGAALALSIPRGGRRGGFERGELVVDNDGLRRAGEPVVERAEGGELSGYQPLRAGYVLRAASGPPVPLPCGE